MARVIGFQPVAKTDFSDGNALFSDGIKNMALAFKQAKDTIDETGQAIRDRNNAILNSYINGIKAEDWDKPETQVAINNMVKTVSDNTANMVDLGKVFDTIDKRQSVLVDRSNAQLENQTNKLVAQVKQDAYDADRLANLDYAIKTTDPSTDGYSVMVDQRREAWKSASPTARNMVNASLLGISENNLKADTAFNKASYDNREATEKFNLNIAKALIDQTTQAYAVINNPNSTPEQVQQARDIVAGNATAISKLGISMDTQAGIATTAQEQLKKEQIAQQEREQKQFNADRDYNLREHTTKAQIAVSQANAETNRLNSDISAYKAFNSGGSDGSGSTSTKNMSPAKKALNELGLSAFVKNGTLSAPQVGNAMVSVLDGIFRQEKAKENEESFNSWINGKGAKYKDAIYNDRFWGSKLVGDTSRYDDIISAIPKDATEYEKKQIIIAMADKNSNYARWLRTGDDAQSAVQNTLSAIRLGREAEIRSLQGKKMDEILTHLATETGQSKTAVYGAIIRRDPSVGWNAPDWFVRLAPELMKYYADRYNNKQNKGKGNSTDKTTKGGSTKPKTPELTEQEERNLSMVW